ncbi:MAG: hypothetical protein IJE68_05930 [Clostridia bacterium]|nr:hypothetical protein [Clostridia bacterium]
MKKMVTFLLILAILSTLAFGAWATVRIIKAVSFNLNCEQYLKRAADANTVELAKKELEKAISYAEEHGLTDGVVSIFLNQPSNDLGFWYQNLVVSLEELENLPEDASALEKTNVLMKLRETLGDQGESEFEITIPSGISIYPDNVAYFWWAIISIILAVFFWIAWGVAYEKTYW